MSKPILAVWHNLPSGGAKRALSEQLKRLKEDFDIHLFSTSLVDDSLFSLEQYATHSIKYPVSDNPYTGFRRILRRFRQANQVYGIARTAARAIDALGASHVFVHPCQIEHAPSILRFVQTSSVYYCQEPLREYYESTRPQGLKAWVGHLLRKPELFRRSLRDRRALKAATTLLVNSAFIQKSVKEIYGREGQICYLGIDSQLFSFYSGKRKNYMLSVGRLTALKGHDTVIQIAGKCAKNGRYVRIIADSADEEEGNRLHVLAQEVDVTLEIESRVSDQRLVSAFQEARVVVCAQHNEPFGFVPLEAMASGTPLFAVQEGGFCETVREGENAYFIPRKFAAAAEKIQAKLADTAKMVDLAKKARQEIEENWTWDAHYKRLKTYVTN